MRVDFRDRERERALVFKKERERESTIDYKIVFFFFITLDYKRVKTERSVQIWSKAFEEHQRSAPQHSPGTKISSPLPFPN